MAEIYQKLKFDIRSTESEEPRGRWTQVAWMEFLGRTPNALFLTNKELRSSDFL